MDTSNPLIGLGLRPPHYHHVIDNLVPIDWFEVHSENFFQAGPPLKNLLTVREKHHISLHGVGLSLGSAEPISTQHLKRLQTLIREINPIYISEHLSWSMVNGRFLPDLLPMPYNKHSLKIIIDNIQFVQDFLGRNLLIENPSSYLEFNQSQIPEYEFLIEICEKTQANILLDINNIYVSCYNHGWCSKTYLDAIDSKYIKQIHLAGHSNKQISKNKTIKIDTHDARVCDEVWNLYRHALVTKGAKPTLIEWDQKLPSFDVLLSEAQRVKQMIQMDSLV